MRQANIPTAWVSTVLATLVIASSGIGPDNVHALGEEPFSADQAEPTLSSGRLPIVEQAKARAVVVTQPDPSRVAGYAVREFVEHIEKATGVVLPVATEANVPDGYPTRIYIGVTQAARDQEIRADDLGGDVFVLRTADDDVYIVGKESKEADPLETGKWRTPNPYSGTLFGVYELLERCAGVRWLWPGELGTFVPRTDTIEIERLDETVRPKLKYRRYRWGGWTQRQARGGAYEPYIRRLGFSDESALRAYVEDMRVFQRRHRIGFSEPVATANHYSIIGGRVMGRNTPIGSP